MSESPSSQPGSSRHPRHPRWPRNEESRAGKVVKGFTSSGNRARRRAPLESNFVINRDKFLGRMKFVRQHVRREVNISNSFFLLSLFFFFFPPDERKGSLEVSHESKLSF